VYRGIAAGVYAAHNRHVMALTKKQSDFCRHYLTEPNGTKAAEKAGYAAGSADVASARLLRNASVLAEIARLRSQVSRVAVVDAAYVLTRLRENVERAMTSEPVRDADGNATGEYRYEGAVANRALELLGKTLGMFRDKVEHSGPDGTAIPIQVYIPANGRDQLTADDPATAAGAAGEVAG
jgi:phage terminase small subunit